MTKSQNSTTSFTGEEQKMVLEARNWFFEENTEEEDSTAKDTEASSVTEDNFVNKFSQRIMYACSPRNTSAL